MEKGTPRGLVLECIESGANQRVRQVSLSPGERLDHMSQSRPVTLALL